MASLRPLDACFLEVEEADDTANLAIAAVAILEGPAPTRSEFAAAVGGRLGEVPRAQQVVHRVPLDLGLPKWVAAEGFDIDRQVRRVALPHPGDDAELCRQIADIMAVRLDRDRPLWECWVVEGLADGRWALLMKLHHSMADGISGTRLFEALCDPVVRPDSDTSTDPVVRGESATRTKASGPVGLASGFVGALGSPRRTVARLVGLAAGSIVLAGRVLVPSVSSSFNGPLTRNRRYGFARASLPDALMICDVFGVTLNDVALAAVSGAVRRQLIRRGEVPGPHTIRSLVPVSYRAGGTAGAALDNEISLMLPYLPVEVEGPVERLRVVHSRMQAAKSDGESGAGQMVSDLAQWVPFAPLAWAVRLMLRVPQHSVALVTTDVPGPRVPLTLLGRRVVELLPYVPIAVRLRLGVAVMSYDQQLAFGVTGDYDGVPDLDELCRGIESDLGELYRAARRGNGVASGTQRST
ncbi:putative diacyglycerol O-acyltransferase tgs1 [Rhodococcus sp. RD6.2]|uniref:wax ester/triacylglycerol synthase family O-acyltransferase n=1 Tax=Rhodococcus sp. RD6.2 TaxID=260936 RepID=UPI00063BA2E9|nr:wax ester/triacylglycerol synthase family O-acyltransferase [Rhodococcus sp. RD6.2]CRK51234.1 putative diacyglycerol O-acyltransferase tgs1 [Rhodococcus sp. RD6.2]